jgi:RNA 2',3'-cyclic 3'-phosphodiesterase
MARLFIAIDLPAEKKALLARLCHGIKDARWVKAEHLHLTLRFIGDATDGQTAQLIAALTSIKAVRFEMKLEGVGTFPPRGRTKVLWVGVPPTTQLMKLQSRVEVAAQAAGFAAEEKTWVPHVTLARFKNEPGPDLQRWLTVNRNTRCDPVEVSAFHLYESALKPKGAVHSVAHTVALSSA